MWTSTDRIKRRHAVARSDQRLEFERDRDRILYSSAFRRLAGITQIVRAGEADVFHTRQQHTLKVAQVGRRLAQICEQKQPELSKHLGVHPEVVEAACLAHDLGHPPFGHIAEYLLDKLVTEAGDPDGFEGNAQTFRVLTRLAVRFDECLGLDLTRATLAACIKYPWFRNAALPSKRGKWGAYKGDRLDFDFARQFFSHEAKSAEAEVMDWADDVAYSVHDLEDFHRCGILPWHRILSGHDSEPLVGRAQTARFGAPADAAGRLREALRRLADTFNGIFGDFLSKPYEGTRLQRRQLRTMTSGLINRYIRAFRLKDPDADGKCAEIDADMADEVRVLKQITRDYIISNPSLSAQQKGQTKTVTFLFNALMEDTDTEVPAYLPHRLRYLFEERGGSKPRFVADCIASLTETEAVGLKQRLEGSLGGSVLDPIVR